MLKNGNLSHLNINLNISVCQNKIIFFTLFLDWDTTYYLTLEMIDICNGEIELIPVIFSDLKNLKRKQEAIKKSPNCQTYPALTQFKSFYTSYALNVI